MDPAESAMVLMDLSAPRCTVAMIDLCETRPPRQRDGAGDRIPHSVPVLPNRSRAGPVHLA